MKYLNTAILALLASGCAFGEDCPVELQITGGVCFGNYYDTGEPEEYYYDENGYALLVPASSDLAQKLVDDGLFTPHGIGACEAQRGKPWTAFSAMGDDIKIACCEDLGCQWEYSPADSFGICYPGEGAWGLDGMIGAIAPLDALGVPQCETLEPLAWQYDYVYEVYCSSVACEGYKDQCACRCYDSSACWSIDHWLGQTYFGGASLPDDMGWESWCTGTPYWWDNEAFGVGGWVGGSCEFNQFGPSPYPSAPSVVSKIKQLVSCESMDCTIQAEALDLLADFPSSLDGTVFEFSSSGHIELIECGDLCQHIGGVAGVSITGLGAAGLDLMAAQLEFMRNGSITVNTDIGHFTFTVSEVGQ